MNHVMLWADLLAFIAPYAPVAQTGGPPFDMAMMLRIHCQQQRFGLSGLGADEALFKTCLSRDSVGISVTQRIPDRVSILRFHHLLEEHALSPKFLQVINAKLAAHGLLLKTGTVLDADSGLLHRVIGAVVSTGGTYSFVPGSQAEFWA